MSAQDSSYRPRAIRQRATKSGVYDRRVALYRIVEQNRPCTVRQVFYLATVEGLVAKTEQGYKRVKTDLVLLRRSGDMPYHWLVDNTRWMRKPTSFRNAQEAIMATAQFYRKALWADTGVYCEIWLEKDALSGVIHPVTSEWDVPLMVARGYASLSFLSEAANTIAELDCPAFIYHLGDFDPSGVNAGEKIEQTLRELAPYAEIHFERLAIHPWQIDAWNLPTRPTKTKDARTKNFDSTVSVELDSIKPQMLRDLVEAAIARHLPYDQLRVLKAAEQSELEFLRAWASGA
jgi:hypothetical protein